MSLAERILTTLRVPDLPYSVGQGAVAETVWPALLKQAWESQSASSVIDLMRAQLQPWQVRQVNAGFLADRMMDMFLRKSGLHVTLVERAARLRFWLAWRLYLQGEAALAETAGIPAWGRLLERLQGWSDSGGRSARPVLEKLDALIAELLPGFDNPECDPLAGFVAEWQRELDAQQERLVRLEQRLLDTEVGAARQRAADQRARALVGRAVQGRQLPPQVLGFIEKRWQPLLRQLALEQGISSDGWRHAGRVLEWLVWSTSPGLADRDMEKLYQVGEQLTDKIAEVWARATQQPLPNEDLHALQTLLVTRIRGGRLDVVAAPPQPYDADCLVPPDEERVAALKGWVGHWFVLGEGVQEQRRLLFAWIEETREVLWTNGSGVRVGVSPMDDVLQEIERRQLRPMPTAVGLDMLLGDTLRSLGKVLESQETQRLRAAEAARAQAEALRLAREEAARQAAAEEAARAQLEAQAREAAARMLAEQQAEEQRREAEQARQRLVEAEQAVRREIDGLKLGGWIEWGEADGNIVRLKLAVRINATNKLVFVDRLGLGKTETTVSEMVQRILEGRCRIVHSGTEFEDTLSRVVGRIRVGK